MRSIFAMIAEKRGGDGVRNTRTGGMMLERCGGGLLPRVCRGWKAECVPRIFLGGVRRSTGTFPYHQSERPPMQSPRVTVGLQEPKGLPVGS